MKCIRSVAVALSAALLLLAGAAAACGDSSSKTAEKGKGCFECHGAVAKDKQLTAKDIIHKAPGGKCVACHKDLLAKDPASKAPTKCKECHGGAE